ncbi:helix-turn-helix domain-containing protein [Diaphorobacter aerolatus]|uniref:Helix-turn-helix transcriptional regulator n=1 Tax=Diaphorobacter aerolatus TaxID=1288495 RepID=A0A7H0GFT8_9BURK|nr:AraC family transcriptional regulator [Diaphorobacter aerolatus]QNP47154.1 helix-turn-helix transcriptional regulator [Diaphorobacter aerolatus]
MARHAPPPFALTAPVASIRHYSGEHAAHAHDHAQILYALEGRMELEVNGRAAFVDAACGMVVPAGVEHGFLASPGARLLVIDAPHDRSGVDKLRRFAVPAALRTPQSGGDAGDHLSGLLGAPRVLVRRDLDLEHVREQVLRSLHENWNTRRMAALVHLSAQRFHLRWLELTAKTPQQWLRDLRLDAAEVALARGDSLETTALRYGYRSASALAFALRRDRKIGARDLRRRD